VGSTRGSDSILMKSRRRLRWFRWGINVMRNLEPSSLVPPGFIVVSAGENQTGVVLSVRSGRDEGLCPKCGTVSRLSP
jgi:hypothetical protein